MNPNETSLNIHYDKLVIITQSTNVHDWDMGLFVPYGLGTHETRGFKMSRSTTYILFTLTSMYGLWFARPKFFW